MAVAMATWRHSGAAVVGAAVLAALFLRRRRPSAAKVSRAVQAVPAGFVAEDLTELLREHPRISQLSGPLVTDDTLLYVLRISRFACKVVLEQGALAPALKMQCVFGGGTNVPEETKLYIANEWNRTRRQTRLKTLASEGTYMLELEVLLPPLAESRAATLALAQSAVKLFDTSCILAVLHIFDDQEPPFATHNMIQESTVQFAYEQHAGAPLVVCNICLEDIQPGDGCRRLPCMHVFHCAKGCDIDAHLVRNKTCPVCKVPIDAVPDDALAPQQSRSVRDTVQKLHAGLRDFHSVVASVREMLRTLSDTPLPSSVRAVADAEDADES